MHPQNDTTSTGSRHRYEFAPTVRTIGQVPGVATIDELDHETSVYAASPAFIRDHCGPIANSILTAIDPAWFAECETLGMLPNIDIRVHRLNIGEYPAVPGWHCDGVLRETYHSQPDPQRLRIRNTVIATVASDPTGVSCTEYFCEPVELHFDTYTDENGSGTAGYALWRDAHQQIEQMDPKPATRTLTPGDIIEMSSTTLHRAQPATVRGWRLFFRMSMWHNPYLDEHGKIARQQQVYILDEANGW